MDHMTFYIELLLIRNRTSYDGEMQHEHNC